jgi:Spy/CpxP family protein refolding chaperone
MKKLGFVVGAASVAVIALGAAAYAHAFGPMHAGMHRNGPIMPCVAVMTKAQRADLKTVFHSQMGTLRSDREKAMTANNALTAAILSGSKDVSSQEAALNTARQQLLKDRDAMAMKVCGQLSSSQLSAASTLSTKLSNLHQSTHTQAHQYFKEAKAAAAAGKGQ